MPEITEAQLAVFQNALGLVQQMNSNPSAKTHLERAIKVVKPDVETEEEAGLRLASPHIAPLQEQMTAIQASLKAITDGQATQQTAAQEATLNARFDALAKQGFTEDGIGKIKQLMVDRGIADPDAAAALFEKNNPPAKQEQPGWTPDRWNFEETASPVDVAGLFKDEDKWADQAATDVLNEIRLGKAA